MRLKVETREPVGCGREREDLQSLGLVLARASTNRSREGFIGLMNPERVGGPISELPYRGKRRGRIPSQHCDRGQASDRPKGRCDVKP